MKKSTVIQLLLTLILIAGLSISSGCGTDDACEGGQKQLPAALAEVKFPVVEGGSICSRSGKGATIRYKNMFFKKVHDKYAEKAKSDGWTFSQAQPDRTFFILNKGGKSYSLAFDECPKKGLLSGQCSVVYIDTIDLTGK